jgi:hypothetical protein
MTRPPESNSNIRSSGPAHRASGSIRSPWRPVAVRDCRSAPTPSSRRLLSAISSPRSSAAGLQPGARRLHCLPLKRPSPRMLLSRFTGLCWVCFGLFGTAIMARDIEPSYWPIYVATALFFGISAIMGYRLFLAKRWALEIICIQAVIIASVLLAGICLADTPEAGGATWLGWSLLLLAAWTALLGAATLIRHIVAQERAVQPGVTSNNRPATPPGNSGATEGPPSVT